MRSDPTPIDTVLGAFAVSGTARRPKDAADEKSEPGETTRQAFRGDIECN